MRNPTPPLPSLNLDAEAQSPAPRPLPAAPRHPVGLLYTMLRHGRGLSHEEAHRISFASISAPAPFGQPDKAA